MPRSPGGRVARGYVAGIDGARGGWLVARLELSDRTITLEFAPNLEALIDDLRQGLCHVAAIDMPIGLSEDGVRPADGLARERLGPRRSTFFPTPVRAVLGASTFESANRINREFSGKGLSVQAWNLVPKIAELDAAWAPNLAERLVEAHPELSFSEMAGQPLTTKKSTDEGAKHRCELLVEHFGTGTLIEAAVADMPAPQRIDSLDALGVLWTAERVLSNQAIELGNDRDKLGRPMMVRI